MEDFILNIKLLNGTLGHKFLEDPIPTIEFISPETYQKNSKSDSDFIEFELNVKGIHAKSLQTDEGIVVLEGSEVSEKESRNYNYTVLREKLISEGIIKLNYENKLTFSKNYLFKNPSPAAAVILGYAVNGRNIWKDKNGKSLNELEQIQV